MAKPPKIVVIGSTNMDVVIDCPRFSRPGETIIANGSEESPGGKGANQAVAAARVGGDVSFLTRVGSDSFADRLIENLERDGVSTEHVLRTPDVSSGVAIVMVDQSGENSIVVIPGANAKLTVEDVESRAALIQSADVLVLQLELSLEPVLAAIRIAKEAGVRVILDPAPAPANFPEELLQVDLICPNQSEAEEILGRPVDSIQDARQAVWQLSQKGARQSIITLADEGSVVCDGNQIEFVAPYPVEAVDTTAAGDAFAAALAVGWAEGRSLIEAVRFANATGALAATVAGAQNAMPTREAVLNRMKESDSL